MRIFYLLLSLALIYSCKNDKTQLVNVFAAFEYDGPKIDSTTADSNRVIFRNVDNSPAVFVNATTSDVCENKFHLGTFALEDTLEWHLRLVDPDGDPANFKAYFNADRELILLNDSLHFVLPHPHDFDVRTEDCKTGVIIVIGN